MNKSKKLLVAGLKAELEEEKIENGLELFKAGYYHKKDVIKYERILLKKEEELLEKEFRIRSLKYIIEITKR